MSSRPETSVLLDVEPGAARPAPRHLPETPFHIALLGDFSGRGPSGPAAGGGRVPVAVDRDDLDAVLARFAPAVRLEAGGHGEGLEVAFRELDDFHPDRLLERVPLFRSIRELAEGRGAGEPVRPRGAEAPPPRAPVEEMLSGSVLDRIVEGEEGGGTPRPDPLRRWVDQVVRPHMVSEAGAGAADLAARVDGLLSDVLRALLHDGAFRRLEALWRGVDFLVRRIETDARLRIWLVDVSREAWAADLAGDPEGSAFHDLLVRGAGPEGEPWGVVAATWAFGATPDDLVALRRAAWLSAAAGTALLAGGEAGLAGAASLAEAGERSRWTDPFPLWDAFRREPEARSVGLLLPRVLLRVPYGAETEPCEALDFEESPGEGAAPSDYLWGSPVIPALVMLADAFRAAGGLDLWSALDLEVGDLPLHVRHLYGESVAAPCTEVALPEHAAERLLDAGLMPFVWLRGSDRIRLLRFQSVASPPARLALGGG